MEFWIDLIEEVDESEMHVLTPCLTTYMTSSIVVGGGAVLWRIIVKLSSHCCFLQEGGKWIVTNESSRDGSGRMEQDRAEGCANME